MAIFSMVYIKKHIFTLHIDHFLTLNSHHCYQESILLQKDVVHRFQEAKEY